MLDRILKFFQPNRPTEEAALDLADLDIESVPTLELGEYCALVEKIPPPTDHQLRDFADFVSGAKSWYKHLPPFAPGAPFYFFIDPHAGQDRVRLSGRKAAFLERTETSERFHYSWMTTAEYRARFGCLTFCCEAGSELFLQVSIGLFNGTMASGLLDNNTKHPLIYPFPRRQFVRIPKLVLNVGRANITGVVHRLAASVRFWEWATTSGVSRPEEAGDSEMIAQIRKRCSTVGEQPSARGKPQSRSEPDPEIEILLRPERERMHMEMIAAMQRMLAMVYSAGCSRQSANTRA